MLATVKSLAKPAGIFLGTIFAISTIQWICIQLLATFCSTWGILGPLYNVLSLGSPMCQFVNHVQVTLSDNYITIWAGAVMSILAMLKKYI